MKVHPPLEPSSASRATPPSLTSHSWAVAGLLPMALALAGCTTARDDVPATAPPHAFISYHPEPAGDDAVRVGVKDLINIKGEVTSAGSEYLYKNANPASRDAACLRLIRQSDAWIVGKTNLSEFAIGVTGSNDYFGTPINPLDPTRIPGGSSSGSAVAVAMGLADIALGTDTAGSIRVPAACCGIAGLKTTFGLISIEGVYPISPRYLDTVGPMAANVAGLVEGMKLLQPGFAAQYRRVKADKPLAKGIRIGRLRIPGTDRAIDEAIDRELERAGFTVVPLDDDFLKTWLQAQRDGNRIAAASSYFNNVAMLRENEISRRSRLSILFGDFIFSRLYSSEEKRTAAIARRDEWRTVLAGKFLDVDAIALPVLKTIPPKQRSFLVTLFEGKFLQIQNTVAVNYAGVPALALPVPLATGDFPVTSLQLVGPAYAEADLLNIGRLLEATTSLGGK